MNISTLTITAAALFLLIVGAIRRPTPVPVPAQYQPVDRIR